MAEKIVKRRKQSQRARAAKRYTAPTEIRNGGLFEYKMPQALYDDLLKECKKTKGGEANAYLCNYVNDQLGLLGTCVRVISF